MSYRVSKRRELYAIIEKDTDLVLMKTEDEIKARTVCRSLNLGSGFNGYTPAFFTSEFGYKQKERPSKK
jgi:hypothetical protein